MSRIKKEIKFIKTFGKNHIYDYWFRFTFFEFQISDLSGKIIFCNIVFSWARVFKAKERIAKGM